MSDSIVLEPSRCLNPDVGRRIDSVDGDHLGAIRHRVARFKPISNSFELGRLRVRLDVLEGEINALAGIRDEKLLALHRDCLKAIASLALLEMRTR